MSPFNRKLVPVNIVGARPTRYRLKGIEVGYKKESYTIHVRRMAKKLLRENCEKSDFCLENFTVFPK